MQLAACGGCRLRLAVQLDLPVNGCDSSIMGRTGPAGQVSDDLFPIF